MWKLRLIYLVICTTAVVDCLSCLYQETGGMDCRDGFCTISEWEDANGGGKETLQQCTLKTRHPNCKSYTDKMVTYKSPKKLVKNKCCETQRCNENPDPYPPVEKPEVSTTPSPQQPDSPKPQPDAAGQPAGFPAGQPASQPIAQQPDQQPNPVSGQPGPGSDSQPKKPESPSAQQPGGGLTPVSPAGSPPSNPPTQNGPNREEAQMKRNVSAVAPPPEKAATDSAMDTPFSQTALVALLLALP